MRKHGLLTIAVLLWSGTPFMTAVVAYDYDSRQGGGYYRGSGSNRSWGYALWNNNRL